MPEGYKQPSKTQEYVPYDPNEVHIDVVDGMTVAFDPESMPPFDDHKVMAGKKVNVKSEGKNNDRNPAGSDYGDSTPWAPKIT